MCTGNRSIRSSHNEKGRLACISHKLAQGSREICRLILLLTLASCSTVEVTSVWQDQRAGALPLDKLLVVGIQNTPGGRRIFADQLVNALEARGIEAVAGYRVASNKQLQKFERLRPVLQERNIDALLVTRVIGFQPALVYPDYYGYRDPYFRGAYDCAYQPGYATYPKIILETNLYEGNSGKLIWSARSEALAYTPPEELAGAMGPLLAERLIETELK
jgi:hypothetical protein